MEITIFVSNIFPVIIEKGRGNENEVTKERCAYAVAQNQSHYRHRERGEEGERDIERQRGREAERDRERKRA